MDRELLVREIREDLNDLIEEHLIRLRDRVTDAKEAERHLTGKHLLDVLGAMQACILENYKMGLGEKEAAMLYYNIADQIVAKIVDKDDRQKQRK